MNNGTVVFNLILGLLAFLPALPTAAPAENVVLSQATPARLERVIARDSDGNGYIDRMELQFDQFVTLTPEDLDRIELSIKGESVRLNPSWLVRSTRLVPGTVFVVGVIEQPDQKIRWDWVPQARILGVADIAEMRPISGSLSFTDAVNGYPFPAIPGSGRVREGELSAAHEPQAISWVESDRYGAVVPLALVVPTAGAVPDNRIRAHIKIYDAAGNLVHSASHDDFIAKIRSGGTGGSGSVVNASVYWNGFNDKGLAVAPGIYRGVVYLDYSKDIALADRRVVARIGIGR